MESAPSTEDINPDLLVDVCAAYDPGAASSFPLRQLLFNGKTYDCLCDTGACRTVLNSEPPNTEYSKNKYFIRDASGHISVQFLTKKFHVVDVSSGQERSAEVLISPSCPVNLLGRDLMQLFDISVVPTPHGMKAVMGSTDVFAIHHASVPNYYWSLDFPSSDRTAQELLRKTRERQERRAIYMSPEELHVTMRFNSAPGPDHTFNHNFSALGPQTVTLEWLYVNPKTLESAASVILSQAQLQFFIGCHTPHVSLSKPEGTKWADLSRFVSRSQQFNDSKYFVQHPSGWEIATHGSLQRFYLGWRVTLSPTTHIIGQS